MNITSLDIFNLLLLLALVFALAKLVRGPSAAERMVAVDLIGLFIGVLIAVQAITSNEESALDIVLVFSIITYLGTVAVARYLQDNTSDKTPPPPSSP